MRHRPADALAALCLFGSVALAGDGLDPKKPPDLKPKPAIPAGWDERDDPKFLARERAVLAFVREHAPELARLVESLKGMKPLQYQRAIDELHPVCQNLSRLQQKDPRRYEVGLAAWQAKARVEVLAARLAEDPSLELEAKLRAAVDDEYDANLRRQKLEREVVREQLRKLDETVERLEKNRDKLTESKYQHLFRKSMEAGNFDPAVKAPAPAPPKKGKGKT